MTLGFDTLYLRMFSPIIILFVGVVLTFVADLRKNERNPLLPAMSLAFFISSFIALFLSMTDIFPYSDTVGVPDSNLSTFHFGDFYLFGAILALSAGVLVTLGSWYSNWFDQDQGFFYALIQLAVAGFIILSASENFIPLILGYEILSIATYALISLKKERKSAAEAGIKYFLVGSLSTSMILFGTSIFFGLTHSLQLSTVGQVFAESDQQVLGFLAASFIFAGVGFKASIVPFHAVIPDVYDGADYSIVNFLAIASKNAAFFVLAKIFLRGIMPPFDDEFQNTLAIAITIIAIITMIIGNLGALVQTTMKRFLAYSGISHAGFMLIAIVAYVSDDGQVDAVNGLTLHMFAYLFMTGAAFLVAILVSQSVKSDELYHYKGLGKTNIFASFVLAISFLSLAGIPPLIGFWSKFYLFKAAIESGYYILAIVGIIMSAVSFFYYGRIIKYMFADESVTETEIRSFFPTIFGLLICLVIMFGFGLWSDSFISFSEDILADLLS
ncbi:MAG: NADH-quinone oxidoreductase subunit N [Candidatus Heimdallarchaeota archaeon]|nr:NADH-quinone oxidoreductase subunit N [Candidatus Heimdallarchaeota archaeon]MCK5048685.1 NADH-quinone oxidoreductase subunit N [Candidatus Heimdallarchaeota archaeon]